MENIKTQLTPEEAANELTLNPTQEEVQMVEKTINNPEAEVSPSTPDHDTTNTMSESNTPDAATEQSATAYTPPPAADGITGLSVIDLAKQSELTLKFNDLINNPLYWGNPNRIIKLEEALFLPKYDDRSLQQFYNSAKDELIKSAMNLAITNKTVPIMPTDDEICPLAEQKHCEKVAKDLRREAVKAAKKQTA